MALGFGEFQGAVLGGEISGDDLRFAELSTIGTGRGRLGELCLLVGHLFGGVASDGSCELSGRAFDASKSGRRPDDFGGF